MQGVRPGLARKIDSARGAAQTQVGSRHIRKPDRAGHRGNGQIAHTERVAAHRRAHAAHRDIRPCRDLQRERLGIQRETSGIARCAVHDLKRAILDAPVHLLLHGKRAALIGTQGVPRALLQLHTAADPADRDAPHLGCGICEIPRRKGHCVLVVHDALLHSFNSHPAERHTTGKECAEHCRKQKKPDSSYCFHIDISSVREI